MNYAARILGVNASELPTTVDDPRWKRIAHYIAQLCANVFLFTSVEKIVIGGGLANNPNLIKLVEEDFDHLINGYVKIEALEKGEKHTIIIAAMKDKMNEIFGAVLAAE